MKTNLFIMRCFAIALLGCTLMLQSFTTAPAPSQTCDQAFYAAYNQCKQLYPDFTTDAYDCNRHNICWHAAEVEQCECKFNPTTQAAQLQSCKDAARQRQLQRTPECAALLINC
ncbi:MAG: hypothetical protein ACFB10_23880 [Salibacteraceae bacterium]